MSDELNAKEAKRQEDLLRWQQLHDWAEGKSEGTVLGHSCTNLCCPLAEYLDEVTGLSCWSVGYQFIKSGDGRNIKLVVSEWIATLLRITDEIHQEDGHDKTGPITREQFLASLEQGKFDAELAAIYATELRETAHHAIDPDFAKRQRKELLAQFREGRTKIDTYNDDCPC